MSQDPNRDTTIYSITTLSTCSVPQQFLRLCLFFQILTGQVFCKMLLHVGLPGVFCTVSLGYRFGGRII